MFYVEFGKILKHLRQSKNLTQTELANLIGLNKAVISKYENSMSYPPYNTLIAIAKTFKVSTDYLLGIEKNKSVDISGLTESQIETIISISNEYRKANLNQKYN